MRQRRDDGGGQVRGGQKSVAVRLNGGLTFLTFLQQFYWPTVEPILAVTTRKSTRWIIDTLENDFGRTPLRDLTPQAVEAWWGRIRSGHRSGRTCNIIPVTGAPEILSS